jgi:O-methyltransferase
MTRHGAGLVDGLDSSLTTVIARLRELRAIVYLASLSRSNDPRVSPGARLQLMTKAQEYLWPEYRLTDFGKVWWRDDAFFSALQKVNYERLIAAERPFLLRELLKLVAPLEGDTAEAGVYRGASSWFICQARSTSGSIHHGFDSFEGLSEPEAADGAYWRTRDLAVTIDDAAQVLAPFNAKLYRGWIPEVFEQAEIDKLVFAHIDVDLYEPTMASLEYFYPRLVTGGIILCDDYGFDTCPGAKLAFDEFMAERSEPIIHSPTGQGFVIKR